MVTSTSTFSSSFEKLKTLHRSTLPLQDLPLPEQPPGPETDPSQYLNGALVVLCESAGHLNQKLDSRFQYLTKGFDQVNQRIDTFEDSVDQRFNKVDQRFNKVDQRFNKVDQRFDKVDQRFEKVDQRFDKVDQRFEKVDQRFEKVDQRFDKVDQRFDEAKAIGFNRFARELDTEIERVPAPIKDENGQTRYEVGASFPDTIKEFWLLRSDVNKLASLARHYSIKGWRRWKNNGSDDLDADQYNRLEDAVAVHRQRCLRILAMKWGLEYNELQRLDGEAEEMRPTTQKRKADDETESRRTRAKIGSEYETEISIVSSKSEEVIVKSRRTQTAPELRVHRQTTLEEVLGQVDARGHSINSLGSTEIGYETSSSARAARHSVQAALGMDPPASSERRRVPRVPTVVDEKPRDLKG